MSSLDSSCYIICSNSINQFNLTTLNVPKSICIIEKFSFMDCNKLIFINFNNGLKHLEYGCFKNCINLKFAILPSTLDSIATASFFNCSSLEDIIVPNVLNMGAAVFSNCVNLINVEFNHDVVPLQTFYGCSSMREVALIEKIKSIEMQAFAGCTQLKTIFIPGGAKWLTYLGHSAFQHTGLETIDISCSNLTCIETSTFSYCTQMYQIKLPKTILSINQGGFSYCFKLSAIDLTHTNLEKIGQYTFYYCTSLKSICLPDSLRSIEDGAFMKCFCLHEIELPSGLKGLGKYAFKSCKLLHHIRIPQHITELQEQTFAYCIHLQWVNFHRVKVIHKKCFYHCYKLYSIYLPDSITELGVKCFSKCISMKRIFFSSNMQIIQRYAFSGCACLDRVIFPQTQLTIYEYAFNNCKSLNLVYFPDEIQFSDIYIKAFPFYLFQPLDSSPPMHQANVFASCAFITQQTNALYSSDLNNLLSTTCTVYHKSHQTKHALDQYWSIRNHKSIFKCIQTILLCCTRLNLNIDSALLILTQLKLTDLHKTPSTLEYTSTSM